MNRVNQIFKRTRWPDDSSNFYDLGFEIAEVDINNVYSFSFLLLHYKVIYISDDKFIMVVESRASLTEGHVVKL